MCSNIDKEISSVNALLNFSDMYKYYYFIIDFPSLSVDYHTTYCFTKQLATLGPKMYGRH